MPGHAVQNQKEDDAMKRGKCDLCGRVVRAEELPRSHTRTEHHPNCDGNCKEYKCPMEYPCGPIKEIQESAADAL